MSRKKIVSAVVLSYIWLMATNYLVHSVWLRRAYEDSARIWRTPEAIASRFWVMALGELVFTIVFVWIYTRGAESKPWAGQGIRYGVLMTLLVMVPAAAAEYVVYPGPASLGVQWVLAGLVQLVVMGLMTAGLCRKPAA